MRTRITSEQAQEALVLATMARERAERQLAAVRAERDRLYEINQTAHSVIYRRGYQAGWTTARRTA